MTNKIVGYQILESLFFGNLVNEVNRLIQKGWEPIGSMTPVREFEGSHIHYTQTMVKRSSNEKDQ